MIKELVPTNVHYGHKSTREAARKNHFARAEVSFFFETWNDEW